MYLKYVLKYFLDNYSKITYTHRPRSKILNL